MNHSKESNQIQKLNKILSELDKGILSGEIESSKIDSLQIEINHILSGDYLNSSEPGMLPMAYESQGLLNWIENDEVNSRLALMKAMELSGVVKLHTQSGQGILGNLKEYSIDSRGRLGKGSPIVSRFALGCAVLGLLLSLSGNVTGASLAVIAIVLGATSTKTSNRNIAVAGLVLGCIGLMLYVTIRFILMKD